MEGDREQMHMSDFVARQVNAILRVIDRDASGRLNVGDFLDRFQVVYSASKTKDNASQAQPPTPEIRAQLSQIGRLCKSTSACAASCPPSEGSIRQCSCVCRKVCLGMGKRVVEFVATSV